MAWHTFKVTHTHPRTCSQRIPPAVLCSHVLDLRPVSNVCENNSRIVCHTALTWGRCGAYQKDVHTEELMPTVSSGAVFVRIEFDIIIHSYLNRFVFVWSSTWPSIIFIMMPTTTMKFLLITHFRCGKIRKLYSGYDLMIEKWQRNWFSLSVNQNRRLARRRHLIFGREPELCMFKGERTRRIVHKSSRLWVFRIATY